ncbi:hypothetical protein C1192_24700 (plasmid) [Escherichia marmotae]|nr:hypothetical protein C1192_24700 [Escherichia marmotae]
MLRNMKIFITALQKAELERLHDTSRGFLFSDDSLSIPVSTKFSLRVFLFLANKIIICSLFLLR